MLTSTEKNTIKMSSNEINFYIQKLEHAKLSNFHFGGIVIRATDQREFAKQNRISSTTNRDLAEKGLTEAEAEVPQNCTGTCPKIAGRAPNVNLDVPRIWRWRAPDLAGGRASVWTGGVPQITTC